VRRTQPGYCSCGELRAHLQRAGAEGCGAALLDPAAALRHALAPPVRRIKGRAAVAPPVGVEAATRSGATLGRVRHLRGAHAMRWGTEAGLAWEMGASRPPVDTQTAAVQERTGRRCMSRELVEVAGG
jgi:hypothetical protein